MGSAEHERLDEVKAGVSDWRRWGTYLSERAWGTVREDYSADGDAWDYFPFEQARSRAYRWNEDGLAGWCDRDQTICLGLALWNGNDPIIKERPFGLANEQGNHGEDVKDYWFYTDNLPTHAYAAMVYKYPQAAFPYDDLRRTNRDRGQDVGEYELFDALKDQWLQQRSTCRSNTRRPTRKTSTRASPSPIAGPSRPSSMSCRTSGIATPGRGSRD
jgi:hypothetical protein